MECKEVRHLIGAYLDSELDTKTNLEVEEHLAACLSCKSAYELEYRFEHSLKGRLQTDTQTNEAWQRAVTKLTERPSRIRRWIRMASAVSTVLLLFLIGWYRWEAANQDLSRLAIMDHEKYLTDQLPLTIHSGSPEEIENFFKDKLSFSLEIPRSLPFQNARLAGARLCHFKNIPVAYLVYYIDNKPVSVFLMHEVEASQFRQIRGKNLHIPTNMKYQKMGDKLVMTCKAKEAILTALGPVERSTLDQLALAYE